MAELTIEICMGTACFVMGSAVLMGVHERIPAQWINRVEVRPSLCCGLCKNWKDTKPPIVKINDKIIAEATEEKIMSYIEEYFTEEEYA